MGYEIEGKAKKAKVIRAMPNEAKVGDFLDDGRRVIELIKDEAGTIPIYSRKKYTTDEIKDIQAEGKPKPKPEKPKPVKKARPKKIADKTRPSPKKKARAKAAKKKSDPIVKKAPPKKAPPKKAAPKPKPTPKKKPAKGSEPKPYPCLCGCGERVDRLFARGHVARLFGMATKRGGQARVIKILEKAAKRLEAHPNWG